MQQNPGAINTVSMNSSPSTSSPFSWLTPNWLFPSANADVTSPRVPTPAPLVSGDETNPTSFSKDYLKQLLASSDDVSEIFVVMFIYSGRKRHSMREDLLHPLHLLLLRDNVLSAQNRPACTVYFATESFVISTKGNPAFLISTKS